MPLTGSGSCVAGEHRRSCVRVLLGSPLGVNVIVHIPFSLVHPSCHQSDLNLQVAGRVVSGGVRHGKVRRDGYRRH